MDENARVMFLAKLMETYIKRVAKLKLSFNREIEKILREQKLAEIHKKLTSHDR